jgi:prepilin-type N-terminal cleavage/methylation domain-containing protein
VTRSRQGFTLLEVVLVAALILVVGALCVPSLNSLFGYYKVQAACDAVRGAWASARMHAMEEGQSYRFAVVPGKGNFRIAPDNPAFWSGDTPDPSLGYVFEDVLPSKVRFALEGSSADANGPDSADVGSVSPGEWVTVAIFLSNGEAQDDRDITFSCAGTSPMTLRLRAMTGIGSVKPNKETSRP